MKLGRHFCTYKHTNTHSQAHWHTHSRREYILTKFYCAALCACVLDDGGKFLLRNFLVLLRKTTLALCIHRINSSFCTYMHVCARPRLLNSPNRQSISIDMHTYSIRMIIVLYMNVLRVSAKMCLATVRSIIKLRHHLLLWYYKSVAEYRENRDKHGCCFCAQEYSYSTINTRLEVNAHK